MSPYNSSKLTAHLKARGPVHHQLRLAFLRASASLAQQGDQLHKPDNTHEQCKLDRATSSFPQPAKRSNTMNTIKKAMVVKRPCETVDLEQWKLTVRRLLFSRPQALACTRRCGCGLHLTESIAASSNLC